MVAQRRLQFNIDRMAQPEKRPSWLQKEGNFGCGCCLVVRPFIFLAMIVIGGININNCPAEPFVPIFLIGEGSVSFIRHLIALITKMFGYSSLTEVIALITRLCGYSNRKLAGISTCQKLISWFYITWLVVGSVFVYRSYKPLMDFEHAGQPGYCNPLLYNLAFWFITVKCVFTAIMLLRTRCISSL